VNFDQHTRTFTCIILQQQPNFENECSINISYGANCGHNLGVYRGSGTTDVIVIPPIDFIEDVDVYCYTAIIPVVHGFPYPDYFTVGVVGNLTFQTRGDTKITDNTRSVYTPDSTDPDSDLIIVISKLLTIIAVLTTIIIIITLVQNKHHSQPIISIKYSEMFVMVCPLLSNCSSSRVCIIILILLCCALMYWCVNL
jgi:hypothetical protein